MSQRFDPHASWAPLRERAAQTKNPRHKKLLNEVANHMEAEINGRHTELMSTLTTEPVYHFWRVGPENMVLQGREAVAGFYANMFQSGGQQFHVVLDRIVVDDGGVITEGQVRQVYRATDLAAMGITHAGDAEIDGSDLWLSNAQLITVWPADPEAKLVGEDIYFGEDPMQTLTPISADELPDYYVL
ncbi:MAG: nuclear transport factor 2 family protein [Pseudomonadota bacterium]